ncbi:MAG: zinc ABC transporter substrate-binding protein [Pseudomonadota bacterium]|jgi:zinc transport system substrate-binding protein|nr:zinc ABC transporter substrate-binding protein [Syntrophaceae bacterium]MDI9555655.1 zinc ABC transporter substrate-binding protein [Pseudomonadota bacterium]NLX31295.1 zinc ABC transporter solute-binding protein [Deltaproteobacteria bacterium]HNU84437.1 zinc ABC transporter substrate-binding protein [Syntrophales bacterium]HNZ34369.1 zinc ABC transporter substrate-binding protein [Syntrophales bacterium]
MKKGTIPTLIAVLVAAFWQTAWGQVEPQRLTVFASILPQSYFLERIGGDRVQVEVLVGEGQSPHTYEPTPKQMARLNEARALFLIGVGFERGLMKKIGRSHGDLLLVETQTGVPMRSLAGGGHANDESIHGSRLSGGGAATPDPHIWMSPRLAKIVAQNIHEALCRLDPAHSRQYAGNLQSLLDDLDRVDARIARTLAPLRGRKMYVFHPAFGYFADAYGLTQVPVEFEGKEPGARQLAGLIDRARADGVRVIFVQPQFSGKSAAVVAAAIGGAVIPINPLSRDYLANLEAMASAVEQGLR